MFYNLIEATDQVILLPHIYINLKNKKFSFILIFPSIFVYEVVYKLYLTVF